MALFQRFQRNNQLVQISHSQPALAQQDDGLIQLIVGLGNIGKEYEDTRHNSGFTAIDTYAKVQGFPAWQKKVKFKGAVSEGFVAGKKVILAKPTTLYNLSGESVRVLKDFYKLTNHDITVVHDELDLPFGTVKSKRGGGSAGSNGLKSIIAHIGADFKRVRIGIKSDLLEKTDPADFVLSKFSSSEKKRLAQVMAAALALLP